MKYSRKAASVPPGQKKAMGGKNPAAVISTGFMTSLVTPSCCQGATSSVITGACLSDEAIFNSSSRTHGSWDGDLCAAVPGCW